MAFYNREGIKMRELTGNGSIENMKTLADKLAYPALLLDKDYKICYKNAFCLNRLIPLRLGSCIKNHLTTADYRRIVQMKTGETIRVSIELPALYGAFVYKGEDCCLVGLRTLSATLQNRIHELVNLNSDLTESILCQMSALSVENGEKGISELIKHKSNRIIRSQQHISEFLRIINGVKNTKTKVCDVGSIVTSIVTSLRDTLRPLGIQITFNNNADTFGRLTAMICEPDFNMLLCLIIYNAIRISQSGKLQVDINVINEKIYFSVMTDTILPEKTARFICEGEYEAESFYNPDGWMYFELLLIKSLCEYYLWNFSITAPGADLSRLQFTMSLPVEKGDNTVFTVRTNESKINEINNLIDIEFADILD